MVSDLVAKPKIQSRQIMFYPAAVTSYLDALAALGERERLERDAEQFLAAPSTLQPFALRALGILRSDRSLLEEAASRFDQLGLEHQAATTRSLA